MRIRSAVRIVLALAVAACADIPSGPAGGSDFDAAWRRWQQADVGEYRYDVQVLCFCSTERTRPVTAVVANGETVSLVYADSLTPADTALFSDVRTMDRIFARLRSVLDQDPARFDATYDPTLGYPVSVDVDVSAQVVDEEFAYQVTGFARLLRAAPSGESSGGPSPSR